MPEDNKKPVDSMLELLKEADLALQEQKALEDEFNRKNSEVQSLTDKLKYATGVAGAIESKMNTFNALHRNQATLLFKRCHEYTEMKRKEAEKYLVEAKSERNKAAIERQQADDLLKSSKEKLSAVETEGKSVLDKIEKERLDLLGRVRQLEKETRLLASNKVKLENEIEQLIQIAEKKKRFLQDMEKAPPRKEMQKV